MCSQSLLLEVVVWRSSEAQKHVVSTELGNDLMAWDVHRKRKGREMGESLYCNKLLCRWHSVSLQKKSCFTQKKNGSTVGITESRKKITYSCWGYSHPKVWKYTKRPREWVEITRLHAGKRWSLSKPWVFPSWVLSEWVQGVGCVQYEFLIKKPIRSSISIKIGSHQL